MKYRHKAKVVVLKAIVLFIIVTILLWMGFSSMTYFTPMHDITYRSRNHSNEFFNEKEPVNLNYIKKQMLRINKEQTIINEKKFGHLKNNSLVIIVQVHKRIEYLKYLISSLRAARGISEVLLVFSHDHFDENINNLIYSINFCKVMQIFYPFSLQMHPNEYPGTDPRDCRFNTPKTEMNEKSCWNVLFTDIRGRYRNPVWVQMKLHWWWKANKLFNLEIMRKHDGLVLFIEEDMYLLEDFITTVELMQKTARELCPNCKVLSLASNVDAINIDKANFNKLNQADVTSQFSNMGFAFTRRTWMDIVDCSDFYCIFDEYNFDFALQHVFTSCLSNAYAMTLNSPRVIHLGTCGVHFSTNDCDPAEVVSIVHRILEKYQKELYPKNIMLVDKLDYVRADKPYGGFGDPRDQALCLGMTIK